MNKLIILIFVLLSFQSYLVLAHSPYIRDGSIGKQKEPADTTLKEDFSFRPVEDWVGEKFIFLPRPKSVQQYGYQSLKGGKGTFGQPSYEECVGRIGTIIKATDEEIMIKMDDNGQVYTAVLYDNVDGIAPLADIDNARTRFLGKTLWYAKKEIATYNDETEKFGSVKLKKYSPIKVVNVVAGWYQHEPVRFILQTPSGEEGFVDINLSGTNVSFILRDNNRFEEYFFTEDPKETYKWSSRIWTTIEEEKVFIGMTTEQARMSWGKPKEINKTITGDVKHEQWVYGSGSYLYFENGILTGIQN